MLNNILSWVKRNYEKLIIGILLILLIITSLRLFLGVDKDKELLDFEIRIKPPQTPINPEPPYDKDLGAYLTKRDFSHYQPLDTRAVFFPVAVKQGPSQPDMSLECTAVISTAEGFVATLRNNRIGKTYKVKTGEQVEIFTVVSITRDVVILKDGEGKQYRLKPPMVPMPFKLTGIMPTETGSEAMLQNANTKETKFVKVGDKVDNWEVLSISESAVIIFRADAGKYELMMGGEPRRVGD